jgi:tetratricopeptide (TPR) repeat protein
MRWWSLALVLASSIGHVHAEPKPSRADELFQRGRKLMTAGNYAEACAAFEESQQIDAAVTTLLNLGACREKRAQLASAVAVFRAAERTARAEGTVKSRELADIAAGHVKRLEPMLSMLTIQVPRANRVAGLTIDRDGVRVEPALWDVPVPVDGGTHTIVARAAGRDDWTGTVELAAQRDSKAVTVPSLPVAERDEQDVTQPPSAARTRGSLAWPIAFGVGALAAGAGAVTFWRRGEATYDRAQAEPDPVRQDQLWRDANRERYMAQGLAVAGVGCAALTVWLLVRRSGNDRNDKQVAIEPVVHVQGLVLQLRGSY